MKSNGIGAQVALEMSRIVEDPEYIKLFGKRAALSCKCSGMCGCSDPHGKDQSTCPCNLKCASSCKVCGNLASNQSEPMEKDAFQIMEEAASLILEASDLLESEGFVEQSVDVMKVLDSAFSELKVTKQAKTDKDQEDKDVNDIRVKDLFGPSDNLESIETNPETGEIQPFEMFKEIEELESDPAYAEPALMMPEARDEFLRGLSKGDEERLQNRVQQQLWDWEVDEINNVFEEIDNEPLVIDLEEFEDGSDVNDSRVLEKLRLPALEDDEELQGAFSDRLAASEKELLALIEALSEEDEPIITDVDELLEFQPTIPFDNVTIPVTEDEVELKMAFDKLDAWINKNASESDKEENEESEDEDFEDED